MFISFYFQDVELQMVMCSLRSHLSTKKHVYVEWALMNSSFWSMISRYSLKGFDSKIASDTLKAKVCDGKGI